jgi:sensor histidine kinase regulating citrate/malate metabolism
LLKVTRGVTFNTSLTSNFHAARLSEGHPGGPRYLKRARVRLACSKEGEQIVIVVIDDGPGIEPSMREAVMRRGIRNAEHGHAGPSPRIFVLWFCAMSASKKKSAANNEAKMGTSFTSKWI